MRKSLLILLVLSPIAFLGCTDTDMDCQVKAIKGPPDEVIGSWKLVKQETVFYKPRTDDYSCNSIIYNFSEDGFLRITSDVEDFMGEASKSQAYELIKEPFFEEEPYKGSFTLKIGSIKWVSWISSEELILDDSHLDGPILHFKRIKTVAVD